MPHICFSIKSVNFMLRTLKSSKIDRAAEDASNFGAGLVFVFRGQMVSTIYQSKLREGCIAIITTKRSTLPRCIIQAE